MRRTLVALVGLAVSGCGGPGPGAPAYLEVAAEPGPFRLVVRGRGHVTPLEQHVVACPQGFWGVKVGEFAAEGTRVATGEVVLTLDLDQWDQSLKQRRRRHSVQLLQRDKLEAQQAQERAAGETQVTEKRLALGTAREKLGILLEGPLAQEVAAQGLMLEAGAAYEEDRDRKLAAEERLRARGFTSELSYLDALGELEKARQRREAARAELDRLRGGPRVEDRQRLVAEEAMIALETGQVEGAHESRLEVQELQRKEKDLEIAASEGAVAREARRLEKGKVLAPASGVVLHAMGGELGKPVEAGGMLWSMQEVMRVVRMDRFKVTARISQRDVDHVRLGAPASVRFPAVPSLQLIGEVTRIGKFAVPAVPGDREGAKVFEVDVLLPAVPPGEHPEAGLKPSLTAQVEIERAGLEGGFRTLPEAVERDGEAASVVTSLGDRHPVTVVAEDGAYVYLEGAAPAPRLRLSLRRPEGSS